MYGTRRAATNWQAHYTKILVQNGFNVGVANSTTFYHPTRKIYTIVHGDDFVNTGSDESLKWLEKIKTSKIGLSKMTKNN